MAFCPCCGGEYSGEIDQCRTSYNTIWTVACARNTNSHICCTRYSECNVNSTDETIGSTLSFDECLAFICPKNNNEAMRQLAAVIRDAATTSGIRKIEIISIGSGAGSFEWYLIEYMVVVGLGGNIAITRECANETKLLLNDVILEVICIDPNPTAFRDGPVWIQPAYKTVQEYIDSTQSHSDQDRPSVRPNDTFRIALMIWPEPYESDRNVSMDETVTTINDWDLKSLELLSPDAFMIAFSPLGASGSNELVSKIGTVYTDWEEIGYEFHTSITLSARSFKCVTALTVSHCTLQDDFVTTTSIVMYVRDDLAPKYDLCMGLSHNEVSGLFSLAL